MATLNGNKPINPILTFLKTPAPAAIKGGGKGEKDIRHNRLAAQRKKLSESFESFIEHADSIKTHNNKTHIIARMFKDSHASTWTPKDIFSNEFGCRIVAPAFDGYLIESDVNCFELMSKRLKSAKSIVDRVDISRVESVNLFDTAETFRGNDVEDLWKTGANESTKQFSFWLLPFSQEAARASVITELLEFHKNKKITFGDERYSNRFEKEISPTPSKFYVDPVLMRACQEYMKSGTASFSAEVDSLDTLRQIAASGTTYRIEPVTGITSNSTPPGQGPEPDLTAIHPKDLPIVVVVDGGRSAVSYKPFEYWAAPPLIDDLTANRIHGNQITSLVCNGHAWNNNLALPELNCQFATVQAIAKTGTRTHPTQNQFLEYLRDVASATNQFAKVWNLSFNEIAPSANHKEISFLGHEINKIAREFGILPIISIGNSSSSNAAKLCPPADCEGALTVSGRTANAAGAPSIPCSVSLKGPAPAGMKKPDLSWFSSLRMIGGVTNTGTSYSTTLISSLAAHTFANLKNPTPDLVRALLINCAERDDHCHELGWGTPWAPECMPWICKDGTVTLAWISKLKAGSSYYWNDLPVPSEMMVNGKLSGRASLTAIIKPLVSGLGGINYFATRLQVALQAKGPSGKVVNLLGSMQEAKIKEADARKDLSKWSPIRRHAKPFSGKSIQPGSMRLNARIFTRDLYQFGLNNHHELPEQEVAFVLTFHAPDEAPTIYNTMAGQLSGYVENATNIDIDIDIEVNH